MGFLWRMRRIKTQIVMPMVSCGLLKGIAKSGYTKQKVAEGVLFIPNNATGI